MSHNAMNIEWWTSFAIKIEDCWRWVVVSAKDINNPQYYLAHYQCEMSIYVAWDDGYLRWQYYTKAKIGKITHHSFDLHRSAVHLSSNFFSVFRRVILTSKTRYSRKPTRALARILSGIIFLRQHTFTWSTTVREKAIFQEPQQSRRKPSEMNVQWRGTVLYRRPNQQLKGKAACHHHG